MSNLARIAFSVVVFAVTSGILWFARHSFGQSTPLVLGVFCGYAVAIWAMFPVQADAAKQEVLDIIAKWRGK